MSDSAAEAIDLAHAADLRLGRLAIRPSLRQILHDDGQGEVLEPRVMQVLLALARAGGAIVTRDELSRWCWEGRVVGDDAINRVISRLRRVADGIGRDSFRIETITKVGYRLLLREGAAPAPLPAPLPASEQAPPKPTRRGLLAGAGAVGLIAAGGGGFALWRGLSRPHVSPEAAELLRQAITALNQENRAGQEQAVGLLQSAVAIQPDFADGWGALAMTYALLSHYRPPEQIAALRERARGAAVRAERIDPHNAYAAVARAWMLWVIGNWLPVERALRGALAQHPENGELLFDLGGVLANVGRFAEACDYLERARKAMLPNPGVYFQNVMALFAADRLDEADRLNDDGLKLYPGQFALWFARVYIYMYSGRATDALAMITNADTRPTGIPTDEFDDVVPVATALVSRSPADADRALALWVKRAHEGSGYAENTIQFASALGRIDDAFAVADAYYFGRGFEVPALRFSREQGTYMPRSQRLTGFLFQPSTAAMRRDPRFARLVDEIGLTRYWREAGVVPDYRRA